LNIALYLLYLIEAVFNEIVTVLATVLSSVRGSSVPHLDWMFACSFQRQAYIIVLNIPGATRSGNTFKRYVTVQDKEM
jgi:hypothetical protein